MSSKNKKRKEKCKAILDAAIPNPGYLTVKMVVDALSKLPEDAKVWAYEGEVCGIIVSLGNKGATLHNNGLIDIDEEFLK
jgi:hypothetical protein